MVSSPLPPPFLIAGNLAIDFVNSRATPDGVTIDWLQDGESTVGWCGAVSLFPEASLRELQRSVSPALLGRVAAEARELRELLRGQLSRPSQLRTNPVLWKTLNELLAQGSAFSVLRKEKDVPRLEDRERLEKPGQLLIPIAKAIARLIVEEDPARLRPCEGVGCSLWFLDQTKAGHRRFCSASLCGNRAKVAAFRSRARRTVTPASSD
jgi:predicted RNA-binding Zn ribbon-like protein